MKRSVAIVTALVISLLLLPASLVSARPGDQCRGKSTLAQPGFAHPADENLDGWVCVHPKNGRVTDNLIVILP
jgi:hypothetical protein